MYHRNDNYYYSVCIGDFLSNMKNFLKNSTNFQQNSYNLWRNSIFSIPIIFHLDLSEILWRAKKAVKTTPKHLYHGFVGKVSVYIARIEKKPKRNEWNILLNKGIHSIASQQPIWKTSKFIFCQSKQKPLSQSNIILKRYQA